MREGSEFSVCDDAVRVVKVIFSDYLEGSGGGYPLDHFSGEGLFIYSPLLCPVESVRFVLFLGITEEEFKAGLSKWRFIEKKLSKCFLEISCQQALEMLK
ncbi:MAG: hypothetical protein ABH833_02070 [Parcubacteria group bacterium]